MSIFSSNHSEIGHVYASHRNPQTSSMRRKIQSGPPPYNSTSDQAMGAGTTNCAHTTAICSSVVTQVEGPGWAQMFADVDAREMMAMAGLSVDQRREHYISQVLRLRTSCRLYPLLVIDCSDNDEGEVYFGEYIGTHNLRLKACLLHVCYCCRHLRQARSHYSW